MTSNALGWVADALEIAQKGSSGGRDTWLRCREGDREALGQMASYNESDIPPLRDLYYRLLPWITGHPNMGIIAQRGHVCTHCKSDDLGLEKKPYRTAAGEFRVWRCRSCGTLSRESKSSIRRELKAALLMPLAR